MSQTIQLRGGTASQWATANPILAERELGVETDTGLVKLGNGINTWNTLNYYELTPGVFTSSLTLSSVSDPSPPSAGQMHVYAHDIAGRQFLKTIGPSGLDNPMQSGLQANRVGIMMPGSSTTPLYFGLIAATAVGTVSHPTMATGLDLNQTMARIRVLSASTANSVSHLRIAQFLCYRGEQLSGLDVGGFFVAFRFCVPTVTSGQRAFLGLAGVTSTIATTQDPAALTSITGVGWTTGDTNLQVLTNDATGTATKIDLGSSFPANNTSAVYDVSLFSKPNGNSIGYRVKRLDAPASASGTLLSDIPAKTQLLTWHGYLNNGGTAAACTLDVHRLYIETDY